MARSCCNGTCWISSGWSNCNSVVGTMHEARTSGGANSPKSTLIFDDDEDGEDEMVVIWTDGTTWRIDPFVYHAQCCGYVTDRVVEPDAEGANIVEPGFGRGRVGQDATVRRGLRRPHSTRGATFPQREATGAALRRGCAAGS